MPILNLTEVFGVSDDDVARRVLYRVSGFRFSSVTRTYQVGVNGLHGNALRSCFCALSRPSVIKTTKLSLFPFAIIQISNSIVSSVIHMFKTPPYIFLYDAPPVSSS